MDQAALKKMVSAQVLAAGSVVGTTRESLPMVSRGNSPQQTALYGTPQLSNYSGGSSKQAATMGDPMAGWKNGPDLTVQKAVSSLVDMPTAAPYRLPRHPTQLYHQQTDALVTLSPASIVYSCQRWQAENPLVNAPFERILRKLPPNVRPSSAGPTVGPMKHPNEPIWFEMVHRLHGILKKQGRRADKRRKRRLRSKLFRGKARNAPTKRDEGKELREYLDRHKAESQEEPLLQPSGAAVQDPGEFLGKVQEKYQINRERVESRPFRVRAVESAGSGKKSIGETRERKQRVVRPVYVPPPASSMAGR